MKKLFLILVLCLVWGRNVFAKEIYLDCKSYRVVGYYKSGGTIDEPGGDPALDTTFKVDPDRKVISELNPYSNAFLERKNVKWSEGYISWIKDSSQSSFNNKINRIDLSYELNHYLKNDPKWSRLDTFYKCSITKRAL